MHAAGRKPELNGSCSGAEDGPGEAGGRPSSPKGTASRPESAVEQSRAEALRLAAEEGLVS